MTVPKRVPRALLEPWAITAEGMRRVVDVYMLARAGAEVHGTLAQAREEWRSRPRLEEPGTPVDGTGGTLRLVTVAGATIGVLSIRGVLFRHANLISEFSGGTTDDALWRGLEAALDPAVQAILLRVDSPGGEAAGSAEFGDALRAAREQKPLWAYVEGDGCSKAYWYASQASRIVANRIAMVGSIGVRVELLDESGAEENAGLRVIEKVSSGAPDKRGRPLDQEVEDRIQVKLDDLEGEFVASVAAGRGVAEEKVYADFGHGDYVIAAKALEVGLVDAIGDLNSTLEELAALVAAAATASATTASGSPANRPKITAQRSRARARKGKATMSIRAESEKKAKYKKAESEAETEAETESEAEGEADDEPVMETEMVECPHCEGEGKMADGSKCETCGGSGKVAQDKADADAETEADSDHGEKHDEPDGDEKMEEEARASLAALVGLKPGARLSQVAAAVKAKMVPLTTVAKERTEHAELRQRVEALEGDKHKQCAVAFVDKAIADGRTMGEKRPHLVGEYVKAEKKKSGSGPAALEPQLYAKGTFTVGRRLTVHGNPVGAPQRPASSFAQDAPEDIRAQYAAKIDEIMKTDKVDYREATARAKTRAPELYAAFAALAAA